MLEYCKKCLLHYYWRLEHPKTKADSKILLSKPPIRINSELFVPKCIPCKQEHQFKIIQKYIDTINQVHADITKKTDIEILDALNSLNNTLFEHKIYIDDYINIIGIRRAKKNKHIVNVTQKGYPGTYWAEQERKLNFC